MEQFGAIRNSITEFEGVTVLQAKKENLVGEISRFGMINDEKEQKLDFDSKILSWNKQIFLVWKPTYEILHRR